MQAAFPSAHVAKPGMTLRDYFAAKAMQQYLTANIAAWNHPANVIADYSYKMADAMLKARGG